MDKELLDLLVDLKLDARALQVLIDTILTNCRLGYDNESLIINDDAAIFAVVKAFREDEYRNRLNELKAEYQARIEAAIEEQKRKEED